MICVQFKKKKERKEEKKPLRNFFFLTGTEDYEAHFPGSVGCDDCALLTNPE